MTFSRTVTITRGLEEYEVEVEFEVTYWGSAGSYWEPPEGLELELVKVTMAAPPWAQGRYPYDAMPFALTQTESEAIYDGICMDPPEQDYGPDPDDERDRRYDDSRYDPGNGIGGDNREEDF